MTEDKPLEALIAGVQRSHQKRQRQSSSDEERESTYSHIPGNERTLTFNDAFLRIAKLHPIAFGFEERDQFVAHCTLAGDDRYEGKGLTLDAALRRMLDKVNKDYSLGFEYEDPFPPAA